eukprot:4560308-Prorocentrum_lima.AAC.1
MLLEYISITGAGRGTGVAGATPDAPDDQQAAEETNATGDDRDMEAPGGTDVVGATEGDPGIDAGLQGGGSHQEPDPT